ncbi:MAG: hypothetical protein EXS29_02380 [Pedosphaera sp.]|nr:hypothetical protein [Pedosphaera sp.]MST00144.1 hypothetical protein [Pedosphaera sp.]
MMRDETEQPASFSTGRRWGQALNFVLAVLAAAALVLLANHLASRHYVRAAWTANADFTLSPLTRQVLQSLTNTVRVVVFYDRSESLYTPVTALLKEYSLVNPRVEIEVVNYVVEPAKAELIKARYRLTPQARDLVIFDANGKTKVITQSDLSQYDLTSFVVGQGRDIRRTGFHGERLFTGALATVADTSTPQAYFLTGHGEHDHGNSSHDIGYGKFAALLLDNGVRLAPLSLAGTNAFPADCRLLIAAGPQVPLDIAEQEKLEKYLQSGGRLLLLLNYTSRSGLEPMLARWGVDVGDNTVIDERNSPPASGSVLVNQFDPHPVVGSLSSARLPLQLVLPRSIGRRVGHQQNADAAKVTELAVTSEAGLAVRRARNGSQPSALRERQGMIPLLVAVEKGGIAGVADAGATRMIVTGDSYFLDNQMLEAAANREFAWHAANWLLDRPQFLGGIGPRPVREHTFTITAAKMRRLFWILVAIIPGACLTFGLLIWIRRQR